MKILVTGCAGFIGSNLTKKLLERNYEVCGIDNFDPYYDEALKQINLKKLKDYNNFKFYKTDILNKNKLKEIFKKEEPELIIHLAARPGVRASIENPEIYIEVNIKGTLSILDTMNSCNVKRLIFGSSSSVYGDRKCPPPFFEEESADKPASPYGFSKRAGEILCYNYSKLYGLKVIILRFFTVYGPAQRPDMAIHKFTKKIIKGEELPVYGDGKTERDYTYVDDITKGILNSINLDKDFEIVNLGNSKPIPLFEVIRILEKKLCKKAKIKKLPLPKGDVKKTWANIEKAKKLLSYNPETDFEKGIEKFLKWHESECPCIK